MFLAFLDYQLQDSQCPKFDHIYEFPPLWSFIPSVLHLFSWLIMDFTDDKAVQCSNRFVFSKYVKFQSFVQLELQMYLKANVNAVKVRTRRKLPSKLQTCPVDTNPVTKLAPNAKELINHNWARFKIFPPLDNWIIAKGCNDQHIFSLPNSRRGLFINDIIIFGGFYHRCI